jgi:putative component of membrane protein insertase Oxa1/YidC/SpoIIIJ protein YidD
VKHLILATIRAYWRLVPARRRRLCLFRESCSRFVYRTTIEGGALAGARALRRRIRQCRSGYNVRITADGLQIVCDNGDVVHGRDVNDELFSHRYLSGEWRST